MNVESESLVALVVILQKNGFSDDFIAEQVRKFYAEQE
jgi:hypothetical protein